MATKAVTGETLKRRRTSPVITAALAAWGVTIATIVGCSGSAGLKSGTDLLTAPANFVSSGVDALANLPVPKLETEPVGSPMELYIRIGRGAGLCWFGTHGVLKVSYIFHAEAEPASRGGRSEIVIHEKDLSMPNPRGARAFRIQIIPAGDTASLDIENLRFAPETGQTMISDVRRWARNELTCSGASQTKGWDAQTSAPAPPSPAKAPAQRALHNL